MSEVLLRTFRNFDPPELVRLWNSAYQSRGVAAPITCDIYDSACLAPVYFDPAGLIVAELDQKLLGFIHVGFCVNENFDALDYSQAVICAIVVDPEYRHQDIGSQLLDRAVAYAESHGSKVLFAGPSPGRDPFYNGIFGGSRPSGFLLTQESLGPFLLANDFEESEQHAIYQKDLQAAREPINFRLITIRRKMDLNLTDDPGSRSWWWISRIGRYDLLRFELVPKNQITPVAAVTVLGLDFFIANWNHRAIGLRDLYVAEGERGKGYGQALLIEVGRRLKEEMVTLIEIHCPMDNELCNYLVKAAGFSQIDTGVVYRRDLT